MPKTREYAYKKFVVRHSVDYGEKDGVVTHVNAFILPDHYDHSLESFQDLVAEARKSFPDIKDGDVECRTVVQSSWCKRQPIVRIPLPRGTPTPEGWTDCQNSLHDIVW